MDVWFLRGLLMHTQWFVLERWTDLLFWDPFRLQIETPFAKIPFFDRRWVNRTKVVLLHKVFRRSSVPDADSPSVQASISPFCRSRMNLPLAFLPDIQPMLTRATAIHAAAPFIQPKRSSISRPFVFDSVSIASAYRTAAVLHGSIKSLRSPSSRFKIIISGLFQ